MTIGPACVNTDMIGTRGTVGTATPNGSAWVQLDTGHYWLLDLYELEAPRADTPTTQHMHD